MCILFMYVNNHVTQRGVSDCPYKFILASNRDEKLSRPTKPARFWEKPEDAHILAGQDLEELGTWLGISKVGKLAVLLNIMGSTSGSSDKNPDTISRGSLVTGFLRSAPGLTGWTYLKNLCHLDISTKYQPFQLITVDFTETQTTEQNAHLGIENNGFPTAKPTPTTVNVTYLNNRTTDTKHANNSSGCTQEPDQITPPANAYRFYAFGNSQPDNPFKKVECGKSEFEKIITEHNKKCSGDSGSSKDSLVNGLLQFLKSDERYFPDENMEKQAKTTKIPTGLLPYFSSRFVSIPGVEYGTRTHTIILVDFMNRVTYHEWTMTSETNVNAEWLHSEFTFTLGSSSS